MEVTDVPADWTASVIEVDVCAGAPAPDKTTPTESNVQRCRRIPDAGNTLPVNDCRRGWFHNRIGFFRQASDEPQATNRY
jgi:hypothetical protein